MALQVDGQQYQGQNRAGRCHEGPGERPATGFRVARVEKDDVVYCDWRVCVYRWVYMRASTVRPIHTLTILFLVLYHLFFLHPLLPLSKISIIPLLN